MKEDAKDVLISVRYVYTGVCKFIYCSNGMMMSWPSLYILDGMEYNKHIPAQVTQNNHCNIKLNKVRFKSLLTVSASDEPINIVILVSDDIISFFVLARTLSTFFL